MSRPPALPSAELPMAGWGLHPVETCRVYRPEGLEELQDLLATTAHSVVPRGLGRSYGDAALNAEGVVLGRRLDALLAFDPESGVLHCEAGVSLSEILEVFLPRGFFFPVTPGTKFITIGGAIASDVHGKNHHRTGSTSAFVEDFRLLLASGEIVRCSREANPDLFWATVGGMGLTGFILDARIRLRPVETSYMSVELRRAHDLDALLALAEEDDAYEYVVSWIDCLASGGALGRSVCLRANHASAAELSPRQAAARLSPWKPFKPFVPFDFPGSTLNPWSVRAFNEIVYRASREGRKVQPCEAFLYPLDRVEGWNRIYGKRGLLQYQTWLPWETAREGLIELLESFSSERRASFLAVLKTFGPASDGLLSFPGPGVTLALDLPYTPDLEALLHRLDAGVARRGGRVYLAKDACLTPEHFAEMYPGIARFREVKTKVDPEGRFASRQARRLGLVEAD